MFLVKTHLWFTKDCQHLEPQSLEDKADLQSKPKTKGKCEKSCGEIDVVLSVLNVSAQDFVWQ